MSATIAPLPTTAPLLQMGNDGKPTSYMSGDWFRWFFALVTRIQSSSTLLGNAVQKTAQTASIGTTTIPLPALSSGVYRVTFYGRVTTAAGVSSSLAVTLNWTDGAVACSQTSTAVTGNTTATVTSGTIMFNADAASAITYATTYASNPGSAMAYKLTIVVEQVA